MALTTSFTRLVGVRQPIVSAPMAFSAGGELAAAVSRGGGFGFVGGGFGVRDWLERELPIVAHSTREPWGVGFVCWAADVAGVEYALEFGPAAVLLSFGDPTPFLQPIRRAGVLLMIQVTDLTEARQALDAGADVIVVQGTESGGHGARRGRSTLPFVPAVVDMAGDTPVLAAGGIADGRGVAAALVLGAAGALLGTRFQATAEAIVDPAITKAIVESQGGQTARSSVLDIVKGVDWPEKYDGRSLAHPYIDRWHGREAELTGETRQAARAEMASGAVPPAVWAGEAVDLIGDLPSAEDLVATLAAEAEQALDRVRPGAG
ncbi:NAD(P)H-dependent flavin oxidoreductase [Herbidospora cretacea]|uniref:NAD(P)H-dependent flavin oxidoreductase n=1 Tax=Herbidospora cretacea TaxID=28444 RepID=UPI0004C3FAC2|nr:nitronate monooxygenase [Herbidospora cretacea]